MVVCRLDKCLESTKRTVQGEMAKSRLQCPTYQRLLRDGDGPKVDGLGIRPSLRYDELIAWQNLPGYAKPAGAVSLTGRRMALVDDCRQFGLLIGTRRILSNIGLGNAQRTRRMSLASKGRSRKFQADAQHN